MKAVIRVCDCGAQHGYYGPRKKGIPEITLCQTCGKPMHPLKPGELGKMKFIGRIKCPACEQSSPANQKTNVKTFICKHCGYSGEKP